MPERFGQTPGAARTALYYLSLAAYTGLIVIGVIALTWPAAGLHPAELAFGRMAGMGVVLMAALCLASYPTHRWRWEMHGTWALGVTLSILAAVVVSVDATAARGLLAGFAIVVVLGVYIRAVQLLLFAHQTTTAALRRTAGKRRRQALGT